MIGFLIRFVLIAVWLWPAAAAAAEPIKLKLAFFSSDRALLYKGGVQPFVDAVNAEAKGLLEIEVFFSGALGKDAAQQAQLVRDGVADIGYIIPGYTEDKFPDNAAVELPGLFRDQREATLVFTRLIAAKALRGYEDFVVIAAVTVEPHSIHTRGPIGSLADLRGLKIRANNPTEAKTFNKLGMEGTVLPVNRIADALSRGTIEGAAIPPSMLNEFGVGRLTAYHYMIYADAPSLALVMNRAKFESLPPKAQDIIRKYSGEWAAARSNEFFDDVNAKALEQLKSDPRRKVIFPTAAELVGIRAAFKQVIDEWVAQNPRNRALLAQVETEIAKLRSGQ
ncbi:MAG TPA: TRAP transporter substrate-binding protein DctP [Hyphomicrobiales bacterium]|jgi:TRAP-type C4-dicarboxylate transport system substrate-binding protein